MRTTITLTVDGETKEKAMPIIQNEMNTSLSQIVDKQLKKIVNKKEKEKNGRN